jgi:hypothetical protein
MAGFGGTDAACGLATCEIVIFGALDTDGEKAPAAGTGDSEADLLPN